MACRAAGKAACRATGIAPGRAAGRVACRTAGIAACRATGIAPGRAAGRAAGMGCGPGQVVTCSQHASVAASTCCSEQGEQGRRGEEWIMAGQERGGVDYGRAGEGWILLWNLRKECGVNYSRTGNGFSGYLQFREGV